jgi:hypothetical protein
MPSNSNETIVLSRATFDRMMRAVVEIENIRGPGVKRVPGVGIAIAGAAIPKPSRVMGGGGSGGDIIRVSVAPDGGGVAGDTTTACSFTYTVSTHGTSDGAYGSGKGVPRPSGIKGKMIAGNEGTWSVGGSALVHVNEWPDRGCGDVCT